jgi:hypothetical protein
MGNHMMFQYMYTLGSIQTWINIPVSLNIYQCIVVKHSKPFKR